MNINKIAAQSGYVETGRIRAEGISRQTAQGMTADEVEFSSGQASVVEEMHFENQKSSEELIKRSLEEANKSLSKVDRYIEREIHDKTKAVMYKIRDRKTGEVIAEFPPKKIQDMIAKMWEFAGMFVDERA